MLRKRRIISSVLFASLLLTACGPTAPSEKATLTYADPYVQFFEQVMARISRNKINATRSSRIYSTIALGLLTANASQDVQSMTFLSRVSDAPELVAPKSEFNVTIAAISAGASIARDIFPTDIDRSSIAEVRDAIISHAANGFDSRVVRESLEFGLRISEAVLKRAKADGFELATNDVFGSTVPAEGRWVPTPPSFQPASDPGWGQLRQYIPATSQCSLVEPAKGSDPESPYENDAQEVRSVASSLSEEQKEIARFWDDGRGRTGTPTGHWLRIALALADENSLSESDTIRTISAVAFANADAMIDAWKEKYTFRVERPVTVLQRRDASWNSYLVTPAFPEYPSGHSTLSRASADVLTSLLGTVSFDDPGYGMTQQSREQFKVSARSFSSLRAAADEASISRLFAGIHYTQGLNAGKELGACVANQVIAALSAQ